MVKLTAREIIAAAESERPQRSTPYFSVSQQRIVRRSDQGMASQWSQNRSFVHIILQWWVWPFYYFDAIFLLLQGKRIGGMDKWSKMPNLGLLSSSWRGTTSDRPSVHYTFQKTQLGFVLDGFQSFGEASGSPSQSEYHLLLSCKRWQLLWMGAMGTKSQCFSCTSRSWMLGFRVEFEQCGWGTGCEAPYVCCFLAQKSSTLWIRFWNMKRAVQCARRNGRFMQLLFVMELASALLANIMFFGDCDETTALSHLLQKPRVWKPLPLIDHNYVLEALFHLERCIRAAIGRWKTSVSSRMNENQINHVESLRLQISVIWIEILPRFTLMVGVSSTCRRCSRVVELVCKCFHAFELLWMMKNFKSITFEFNIEIDSMIEILPGFSLMVWVFWTCRQASHKEWMIITTILWLQALIHLKYWQLSLWFLAVSLTCRQAVQSSCVFEMSCRINQWPAHVSWRLHKSFCSSLNDLISFFLEPCRVAMFMWSNGWMNRHSIQFRWQLLKCPLRAWRPNLWKAKLLMSMLATKGSKSSPNFSWKSFLEREGILILQQIFARQWRSPAALRSKLHQGMASETTLRTLQRTKRIGSKLKESAKVRYLLGSQLHLSSSLCLRVSGSIHLGVFWLIFDERFFLHLNSSKTFSFKPFLELAGEGTQNITLIATCFSIASAFPKRATSTWCATSSLRRRAGMRMASNGSTFSRRMWSPGAPSQQRAMRRRFWFGTEIFCPKLRWKLWLGTWIPAGIIQISCWKGPPSLLDFGPLTDNESIAFPGYCIRAWCQALLEEMKDGTSIGTEMKTFELYFEKNELSIHSNGTIQIEAEISKIKA